MAAQASYDEVDGNRRRCTGEPEIAIACLPNGQPVAGRFASARGFDTFAAGLFLHCKLAEREVSRDQCRKNYL